jgi:UDP-3-O-[3-hydroxymyristoyl] glucosamine N-acyltransferase
MTATLGEIAATIDAELRGDPAYRITNVASLHNASSGDLTFYANKRYKDDLEATRAGAVMLAEADAPACPTASLITGNPYLAYAKAARFLNPTPKFAPGIHPAAVIEAGADIAAGVFIGANTVIGRNAVVGARTCIGPACVVEADVKIGSHCHIHSRVSLMERVEIGKRVLIHPGVVIGADGYGIANDSGRWLKIPQLGNVIIGDDVEIGANTTIDRGAIENTVIEAGVKIDNQVQIGHNVRVGEHTAIAGAAVVAGSVTIGRRCMIGGASAITGHIEIADDVVLTGMSGVSNSIRQAGVYSSGVPITDNVTWRKNMARFRRLDELARRVSALEKTTRK